MKSLAMNSVEKSCVDGYSTCTAGHSYILWLGNGSGICPACAWLAKLNDQQAEIERLTIALKEIRDWEYCSCSEIARKALEPSDD